MKLSWGFVPISSIPTGASVGSNGGRSVQRVDAPRAIAVCLWEAVILLDLELWDISGSLILVLGLLTALNAPFDWASLGLTRGAAPTRARSRRLVALRSGAGGRGSRRSDYRGPRAHNGRGSAGFDALAVHGGGKSVLPLAPLFDGIASGRSV